MKICGCTSVEEALVAVDAGVDAVGVLLAEDSPRRVGIDRLHEIAASIPAFVTLVAVFVDPSASLVDEALKVGAIPQFHGNESAESCEAFAAGPYLKAYHIHPDEQVSAGEFERFARDYAHATWLFDTARANGRSGGTGMTFPWEIAQLLGDGRRFVVSGGLHSENVGACVRALRPYAVDVRSGVETDGVKDPRKVRAFVRAVRDADAEVPA